MEQPITSLNPLKVFFRPGFGLQRQCSCPSPDSNAFEQQPVPLFFPYSSLPTHSWPACSCIPGKLAEQSSPAVHKVVILPQVITEMPRLDLPVSVRGWMATVKTLQGTASQMLLLVAQKRCSRRGLAESVYCRKLIQSPSVNCRIGFQILIFCY